MGAAKGLFRIPRRSIVIVVALGTRHERLADRFHDRQRRARDIGELRRARMMM